MKIRYKIAIILAASILLAMHGVPCPGFSAEKDSAVIKKDANKKDSDGVTLSGADEGEYIRMADPGDGIVILRGNIKMKSGERVILAKKVVYNRETGDITFLDDVSYSEGDYHIKALKCVYNVKEDSGVLYNAESSGKPIIFKNAKLKIVNSKTYIGEDINATTCDLDRPHYHFLVSKIWIYSDRRAVAYNAVYVVGDIPIFYLPVLVQTNEGTGIITQLGESSRRGYFMQNTVKYASGDNDKWKYKFDIYEKLGYYGGIEYKKITGNFYSDIYLGGARYKPVDANMENTALLPDENWYKTIINSNYNFFRRPGGNSYYNLSFAWMNNRDFERQFDNRHEPETTLEMIRAPITEMDSRRYLKWVFTLGDRGDRHNVSLTFERQWLWNETLTPEDVSGYKMKGMYMPHTDRLPVFGFNYNNSFFLFGKPEKKSETGQSVNWDIHLGGDSLKQYLLGEEFKTFYTTRGYYNIYTVFPFFRYLTYTPGIKLGFIAQWVRDPNDDTRETSRVAAEKNSYEYAETSNTIRIGLINYYFQLTHYYRRSFLEKEVTEPFIHEKRSYFDGGIYLFPFDGVDMSVETAYDVRREFPFDDERWKDVTVTNNIFLDLFASAQDKESGRKKGLFFTGIALSNVYKYIAKSRTSGYNTLDVTYTTGNFSIPGIRMVRSLEAGYNYFHDFRYSFRDMMSFKWGIQTDVSRLWRVGISGNSQADRAYLYYDDGAENIFDDMEKSIYYYDRDKSKRAIFTLRNLSISVIHDLHCWELGFYYDLRRLTENVGPGSKDRLTYYDQAVFITLTLKTFSGKGLDKTRVYPAGETSQREF